MQPTPPPPPPPPRAGSGGRLDRVAAGLEVAGGAATPTATPPTPRGCRTRAVAWLQAAAAERARAMPACCACCGDGAIERPH
eukprot:364692-Chlamydomonas_euryale.AAC.20